MSKNKNKKTQKKSRNVQQKPSINKLRIIIPLMGLLILVCVGLYILFWPRFVWIVEDQYVETWEKVLRDSSSLGRRVIPLSTERAELPRTWYGYRIGSAQEPQTAGRSQNMVRVYRGLAGSRQYGPDLPLALDPWLIFRKFTSPALSRNDIENGPGGNGRIFMAGNDQAAIWAWSSQFLQEIPGTFIQNEELWEQTRENLFLGQRFQTGARTYSWEELWPHLLGDDENVWVYAPLSRIRGLPLHETNILEADVFPVIPGWTEFGLQAEILWAIPYGNDSNLEKLEPVRTVLQSAPFQTLLADNLGWLAIHHEAPPLNPVSWNARISWLTSSYLWTVSR